MPDPHDAAWQAAISEALEMERRRIAAHVQTTLISQIELILAQINAYEASATGAARMPFSVVAALVQQLWQRAADLETNLHPTMLETLGLAPALEALANQQRRTSGASLTLSLIRLSDRLTPPLELALFRLTQEIVTRTAAAHFFITLTRQDDVFRYTIADDAQSTTLPEHLRAHLITLGCQVEVGTNSYGEQLITVTWQETLPITLTAREMDVIRLLAAGLTNQEIALKLDVRARTVKFHLDNIYSKLGVSSRTEAAIYALRQGWV